MGHLGCESLLHIYFSMNKEKFLSRYAIGLVDSFLMYCEVRDKMTGSDDTRLTREIYSWEGYNQKELLRRLGISNTTYYRFRERIVENLVDYVDVYDEQLKREGKYEELIKGK